MNQKTEQASLLMEHDHNHLEVLWEDLTAVIQVALKSDNEHLMEDVRQGLAHLREEVLEHAAWEERSLYPLLLLHNPGLRDQIERLEQEHRALRVRLAALEDLLAGPGSPQDGALLLAPLAEVRRLWEIHSDAEWSVLIEHMPPATLLSLLERSPLHIVP